MKMTVEQFIDKFRLFVGDNGQTVPTEFIITGLNWAFNSMPSVPKLSKAFAKHLSFNLDAKGNYKWDLSQDFRRVADIPVLNFFQTTGGEPCKLKVCYQDNRVFYSKNGLVEMKKAGVPCDYTLEQEDDHVYLVFDRPLSIPVIVDYIIYGYPKPVQNMTDKIELSAVIENLILATLEKVFFEETQDFAFSGAVLDILDNKYLPEAIQMLNKRFAVEPNVIIGEM